MSTTKRIIARLDIKGPNLVKGIHLEGLRVLGKPWDFARYYYENGADELIFQDVVASLYGRNCLQEIISRTAKEIFIPLTVGGGIKTLKDIGDVLRSGADKVSINTAAIQNPQFIKDATEEFGTANIVVTIEAIKQPDGRYFAFTDNAREFTGVDVMSWAEEAESLGAGEIIITSVDLEGTGNGFDLNLIKDVSERLSIPVIAHGGASKVDHIKDIFEKSESDAVAIASCLHYGFINNIEKINDFDFEEEGNLEFVKNGRRFKNFGDLNIQLIKEQLLRSNLNIRA